MQKKLKERQSSLFDQLVNCVLHIIMVLVFVIMLDKEIAVEANYDINQLITNYFSTPFPDLATTDNLTSKINI